MSRVVDLGRLRDSEPADVSSWFFTSEHVDGVNQAREAVGRALRTLYIDMGVDDERAAVERDLDSAGRAHAELVAAAPRT